MSTTVRRGAGVVLLVFFVACGSSGPTAPSGTSQPLITFPPLSGPSRSFAFDGELTYQLRLATLSWWLDVMDFTRNSRFVLYDNGAFVLQYLGEGAYGYRGQFQDANGVLMFLFEGEGRSVGDAWDDATGTLKGDSLKVQYDEIMQHADFEDAVYVLTP